MKIEILVDENATDLNISVTCKQLTPDIEKMLATLRMMNHQLMAKKNKEAYLLDITQVIYIESVDRKCFVYTSDEMYETDFRLYELEQRLEEYGFFRVSKSFLIHLQNVQSLKAEINRKIRITMSNGEQIIASRQYTDELKKRMDMFCLAFGNAAKDFSSIFELGNQGISVEITLQFLGVSVLITGEISRMLNQINNLQLNVLNIGVIVTNILIAVIMFIIIFKKCRLS